MASRDHVAEIMLVDDVPQNLEVLSAMLHKAGYKIRPVTSGEMALKSALAYPPDMILLDIMMPVMDGYQVCERLKADGRTREIPVIFISAKDATFDKVRAFQIGGTDYITKPFFAHEVMARVETHLSLYWQKQTLQQQRDEIDLLLKRERKHYDEMTRLKDDFLQMVSHDLKNPITFVRTAVYMLRQSGRITHDKDRHYLEIIEEGTSQMMSLVVDVLDLARLETGIGLNTVTTPLNLFVERQVKKVMALAHDKSLILEFHPVAGDVLVQIDDQRMTQAVQNLISNAIKYTHEGRIDVEIQQSDTLAFLTVADTGLGVPAANLPHIFDKFYRVPRNDESRIEGSGLGLAITKMIVELHGGEIMAESEEGSGTVMHVALPRHFVT